MVDILPQTSTLTAAYYVETVLPLVINSICRQRQTAGTSKTLLLHNNASVHKAKVIVTFLKEEQNIQVLAHPSHSTDLAFGCSLSSKKSWLGGIFPAIRISKKQQIQSSVHRLYQPIKMLLNLGADD